MEVVSVILCTRNRAEALQKTLERFLRVRVPSQCTIEWIIIDNGSTDDTWARITEWAKKEVLGQVVCLREARPGKAKALNLGLKQSRGNLLVFTDDDVIPDEDWLIRLTQPLLQGEADATRGAVKLAPHLERDWMTSMHRWWLASTADAKPCQGHLELIGANMAVHRRVLAHVPGFDENLGPGALGLGEDSLFSWQLHAAGLRIKDVPEAKVVHHLNEDRLARQAWLKAARSHGANAAYRDYHWLHCKPRFRHYRWFKAQCKLALLRVVRRQTLTAEGCPLWEMSAVQTISYWEQLAAEARGKPKYTHSSLSLTRFTPHAVVDSTIKTS